MQEERLIHRGAEADLTRGVWQGLDAVFKTRKTLPYRLPEIDSALRHQRTLREGEMLRSAKRAGVPVPYLYFIDPGSAVLVMEFIEGPRLKDVVDGLPRDEVAGVFLEIGRKIAKLHSSGIMHGDLTTANIMRKSGELVFIDFGLSLHSAKVEDHAVDLRLIKETISGAHPKIASRAFSSLLEGYQEETGKARTKTVARQLAGIERRGRYARMV